ncbi:ATP-binding protein [Nonomuraea sp. NPDC050328]|uniref:ATP-binding protein n=1 Tax=Nonomuraea sp. NPDC050328 TaxID=3364361 RepID=UPI0037901577
MTGNEPIDVPRAREHGPGDPLPGGRLLVDQPFDRGTLYAMRATLEAHLAHAGLPEGRVADVVITMHELATNAVLHGAGSGRLRIWRTDGALHCEVHDAGRPKPAGPAEAWPFEHGHGLWIARYLATHLDVRTGPGGSTVTVVFPLPERDHRLPFSLSRRRLGGHTVLALTGDLDQHAARELGAAVEALLAGERTARLVLDLSGIGDWDATGVAALITVQHRVTGTPDGFLLLAGVAPEFRERLDALGTTAFAFCDNVDQARGLMPRPAAGEAGGPA